MLIASYTKKYIWHSPLFCSLLHSHTLNFTIWYFQPFLEQKWGQTPLYYFLTYKQCSHNRWLKNYYLAQHLHSSCVWTWYFTGIFVTLSSLWIEVKFIDLHFGNNSHIALPENSSPLAFSLHAHGKLLRYHYERMRAKVTFTSVLSLLPASQEETRARQRLRQLSTQTWPQESYPCLLYWSKQVTLTPKGPRHHTHLTSLQV